jgi:DNA-directed RNA polymerase beta subunit
MRPLLTVDANNVPVIISKGLQQASFQRLFEEGAVEYIDAWEQASLVIASSMATLEWTNKNKTLEDVERTRSSILAQLKSTNVDAKTRQQLEYELWLANNAIRDNISQTKYTHCELDPNVILGFSASIIPLINFNQGPRNTFQCNMARQALGIYHSNYQLRFDNQVKMLAFPTRPLVETQMAQWIGLNEQPAGENLILAIMTYSGFNQEDAIIFNKGSIDRGRFMMVVYRSYRVVVTQTNNYIERIERPKLRTGEDPRKYAHLDSNGIAIVGERVKQGDIVICKARYYNGVAEPDYSHSAEVGLAEDGIVDRVLVTTNVDNNLTVVVRIRQVRTPVIGDKFASRYAQKATIGLIVPEADMPFTLTGGIRPDAIINPHCIPSRMTMGKLLEIVASKVGALRGEYINGTSFNFFNLDEFMRLLKDYGFQPHGLERMVDGRTGEMYDSLVMIGPCYYQALRHHVADKYYSRSNRGKVSALTRAPIGGRQNGGALRVGEMERDAFIYHGAAGVLLDRLCLSSDAYKAVFCRRCGRMPVFSVAESRFLCRECRSQADIGYCVIPYIFKVITDYLVGAGINLRLTFKTKEELEQQLKPYYEAPPTNK